MILLYSLFVVPGVAFDMSTYLDMIVLSDDLIRTTLIPSESLEVAVLESKDSAPCLKGTFYSNMPIGRYENSWTTVLSRETETGQPPQSQYEYAVDLETFVRSSSGTHHTLSMCNDKRVKPHIPGDSLRHLRVLNVTASYRWVIESTDKFACLTCLSDMRDSLKFLSRKYLTDSLPSRFWFPASVVAQKVDILYADHSMSEFCSEVQSRNRESITRDLLDLLVSRHFDSSIDYFQFSSLVATAGIIVQAIDFTIIAGSHCHDETSERSQVKFEQMVRSLLQFFYSLRNQFALENLGIRGTSSSSNKNCLYRILESFILTFEGGERTNVPLWFDSCLYKFLPEYSDVFVGDGIFDPIADLAGVSTGSGYNLTAESKFIIFLADIHKTQTLDPYVSMPRVIKGEDKYYCDTRKFDVSQWSLLPKVDIKDLPSTHVPHADKCGLIFRQWNKNGRSCPRGCAIIDGDCVRTPRGFYTDEERIIAKPAKGEKIADSILKECFHENPEFRYFESHFGEKLPVHFTGGGAVNDTTCRLSVSCGGVYHVRNPKFPNYPVCIPLQPGVFKRPCAMMFEDCRSIVSQHNTTFPQGYFSEHGYGSDTCGQRLYGQSYVFMSDYKRYMKTVGGQKKEFSIQFAFKIDKYFDSPTNDRIPFHIVGVPGIFFVGLVQTSSLSHTSTDQIVRLVFFHKSFTVTENEAFVSSAEFPLRDLLGLTPQTISIVVDKTFIFFFINSVYLSSARKTDSTASIGTINIYYPTTTDATCYRYDAMRFTRCPHSSNATALFLGPVFAGRPGDVTGGTCSKNPYGENHFLGFEISKIQFLPYSLFGHQLVSLEPSKLTMEEKNIVIKPSALADCPGGLERCPSKPWLCLPPCSASGMSRRPDCVCDCVSSNFLNWKVYAFEIVPMSSSLSSVKLNVSVMSSDFNVLYEANSIQLPHKIRIGGFDGGISQLRIVPSDSHFSENIDESLSVRFLDEDSSSASLVQSAYSSSSGGRRSRGYSREVSFPVILSPDTDDIGKIPMTCQSCPPQLEIENEFSDFLKCGCPALGTTKLSSEISKVRDSQGRCRYDGLKLPLPTVLFEEPSGSGLVVNFPEKFFPYPDYTNLLTVKVLFPDSPGSIMEYSSAISIEDLLKFLSREFVNRRAGNSVTLGVVLSHEYYQDSDTALKVINLTSKPQQPVMSVHARRKTAPVFHLPQKVVKKAAQDDDDDTSSSGSQMSSDISNLRIKRTSVEEDDEFTVDGDSGEEDDGIVEGDKKAVHWFFWILFLLPVISLLVCSVLCMLGRVRSRMVQTDGNRNDFMNENAGAANDASPQPEIIQTDVEDLRRANSEDQEILQQWGQLMGAL